jgi:hypothetical protein
MPDVDELDQLAEMHRAGEINTLEYARGVSQVLAQDDDEAMQAALGVRPVRPWVQQLKSELRDLDDAWKTERRKYSNPQGLSWIDNSPSYWKAIGPGIGAAVFGMVTLATLVSTPWGADAGAGMGGLEMAKFSGLLCLVGLILCVWNIVKASNYSRAISDYNDKRTRLILKRCAEHYGPRQAGA